MAIEFNRYRDKQTKELVKAFEYKNIYDFPLLVALIGDVQPHISQAQTRVYEGTWFVRYPNDQIKTFNCKHGEDCFQRQYELYA